MNRTMAVIVVAQEIIRRESFDVIPRLERWRMRAIWLSYRDINMDIEWQLREELRLELE